jgi:hypothetical protein
MKIFHMNAGKKCQFQFDCAQKKLRKFTAERPNPANQKGIAKEERNRSPHRFAERSGMTERRMYPDADERRETIVAVGKGNE